MMIRISFLLLLSFFTLQTQAQDETFQNFLNDFKSHHENRPVEKVFLHLDKTEYAQAETIWFQSYLLDGTSHQASQLSKTVYVELLNAQGQVTERTGEKSFQFM